MNTFQKSTSQKILFVDYVPAELKETTSDNWRVVFQVKIPGKEKMKRYKRHVPKISNKRLREQHDKRMCENINRKLARGWSPFYEGYSENEFQLLVNVLDKFIEQSERRFKDNLLRKDTLRSYISFSKNIVVYLKHIEKEKMFTVEFDRAFIIQFLDHIYFEKKRTARTSNNYLSFCNQLAIFMVDRGYIPSNPASKIQKRKVGKKKREILPGYLRNDIFKYLGRKDKPYLTLCLTVYFCFIRRTELTKLKVKHIDLDTDTIFIPAEISKNKKDGVVTIPKMLKKMLADHIHKSLNEDFLFSSDNFQPGREKIEPKKISDEWTKMRNILKFDSRYQFYSLKDTGITQLFLLGVPAMKIRDQARHHDIKITESYTPRNLEADNLLKELDFNF
ncbi:tyrosine-type recombinase/integrase [Mesonia maritima]|uniref:Integrase n=1 Tax=Mesonia maritima TaxID=1793873 RepID=A0ABU1K3N8_9FLAO|nr:tyrosine-type recombinase/integrase [Mesonia maritima]MDR6300239.1 integrase [Mesonia maritima]